ncbi:hypothetical protein BKA60DRAFT_557164 [Fusarium oxysporum]|nr:hypothetical protein BKA60DRAFT_557164 [Fusarium oxysporum]
MFSSPCLTTLFTMRRDSLTVLPHSWSVKLLLFCLAVPWNIACFLTPGFKFLQLPARASIHFAGASELFRNGL